MLQVNIFRINHTGEINIRCMFFSDVVTIKNPVFLCTERRDFFIKDVKINVLPNKLFRLQIKRGCICGCGRFCQLKTPDHLGRHLVDIPQKINH